MKLILYYTLVLTMLLYEEAICRPISMDLIKGASVLGLLEMLSLSLGVLTSRVCASLSELFVY
jgi:hypothetical protein